MPLRATWKKVLAAAAVLTVGVAVRSSAGAAETADAIPLAPAFTGQQLAAPPTANWPTIGGSYNNQRYSPLDGINKSNVAGLKAVWRGSLNGSGMTPQSSNEGQPLVYDGVIYVQTGEDDAFAMSVETGQVLWTYKANIKAADVHPCCSWATRGLGLGDGKVFVGRLDAKLEALDQKTGKQVWEIQAEDPAAHYVIVAAPIYYDGLVIVGFAGSDMGTRGRIKAYDAKDGHLVWTFYTVPGPGEFGHDTWPKDSEVWKYGGAAIWQSPAIDPELGMVYFSTANPGPVLNGALRKGDNLFSASIVALDAHTGKYKWHFQEVHHDMWDYDAPNPVILFDAPYHGQMRKGLAEAGKTGWVYILDRVTGKPLVGIDEKPVMQLPEVFTSKTQPFPVGDALVPQQFDIPPEGVDVVNDGKIFTPFARTPVFWKPLGAVNWPPSSYDPKSHLMFVCAADSSWGAVGGDPNYPVVPGALYSGSVVQRGGGGARRGVLTGIDVTTNKIAWHQVWTDSCYAGSLATGSGLLFIGRNDGRLTALDSSNGKKLWEFQTDGGVNAAPTMFEYKGRQYVLIFAGGASLGGSKRSDGVWLFSLDGTLGPLPRGAADPAAARRPAAGAAGAGGRGATPAAVAQATPPGQGAGAASTAAAAPLARTEDLAAGKEIFSTTCVVCHGDNGEGGVHGGPRLTKALTRDTITTVVTRGRNDMPAFGAALSPEQMQDLAAYVMSIAH